MKPLLAELRSFRRARWPALLFLAAACGGDEIEVREALPTTPAEAGARASTRAEPELPPRPARTELANGLVVEILEEGSGKRAAAAGRRVTMHQEIRVAGTEEPLESTSALGIPFSFTLGAGDVVKGLDRGLVGARAGDRLRITIPAALAYGESGLGAIPANADLTVEVQVLRVD